MDTKPLERFSTQARRELLAAVDAQATAVLATGSVARTERGEVVKKLEAEIAAHGRTHVIDKVAYTWFNRIIALRFMDARSYTAAGVVSPAQGQAHGQPEILADAKRGNLNTDVVINKNTAEAITGLLDGTRRSTDAEGEAYALLLTEYCRYWHKSMPSMFEREGDYTELLVPTGLLADGAILSQAREVLTEDVCADVEVIGWLYQFYISERKDEVFGGFKKNKKAGADEIPAATQLFTPHWIVRYLVENSLGRLWMLNRPNSRLVHQMDYYIAPVDEETDFLTIAGPEELTVIDPACGSGHMLTYAFDLLYAIYEEEGYAPSEIPSLILTHNLYGTEIDPRAGSLAAFALTMKARANNRTFFNKQIQPNICVIRPIHFAPDELDIVAAPRPAQHEHAAFWNQFENADVFGSLIDPNPALMPLLGEQLSVRTNDADLLSAEVFESAQGVLEQAKYLSNKYAVVLANPPYLGRVNMGGLLSEYISKHLPEGKFGLDAAFIARSLFLVKPRGIVGMITMQAWMFKSSYIALRESILRKGIITLAHLGPHAFEGQTGQVVSTCAFVLGQEDESVEGRYLALSKIRTSEQKRIIAAQAIAEGQEAILHSASTSDLRKVPGAPVSYWLGTRQRDLYSTGSTLARYGSVRKGMDTGNHDRFLRRWSEVSRSGILSDGDRTANAYRWVPYNKGGAFRRWYGNQEYVVLWESDGASIKRQKNAFSSKSTIRNESFYFKEGFTYSEASFGDFSARYTPGNAVFDSAGATIFSEGSLNELGALVNTVVADLFFDFLCNGNHFQPGAVAKLLVLPEVFTAGLSSEECVTISKRNWDDHEDSIEFATAPLLRFQRTQLVEAVSDLGKQSVTDAERLAALESANNKIAVEVYGLSGVLDVEVRPEAVTLTNNALALERVSGGFARAAIIDFVSFAVGCMFGRYSLDEPGLILADQGSTLQEYLRKVPAPTYPPDADNVIPFVDDGWFEDDIVERFREFLRAAFGAEHFEKNLRFVEESLGVRTLRDYFITRTGKSKFYDDHVKRYKSRPIYWLFSSPKGSFNALIYIHRYNPATVSTVLNEYLREYRANLEVALTNAEQAAAAGSAKDQKEADRLRKVLSELRDYEHDVLYPLATQQLTIDLDDGVKENYSKFYPALKKITGLEAAE